MDSSRRSGSSRGSGAISRAVSAHCLATNQSMISIAQRGKLHDSKSRKLAFTEFHNSAQFRKDSVSVFLGDDTSIHYIALSDPMLTDTNVRSTMPSTITRDSKAKGAESKPLTSASSSTDEIYALHPTSSTQRSFKHASSYSTHTSLLNALGQCEIGKKPIVVAGGQIIMKSWPDRTCPTWTRLYDTHAGPTIVPQLDSPPTPPPNCSYALINASH